MVSKRMMPSSSVSLIVKLLLALDIELFINITIRSNSALFSSDFDAIVLILTSNRLATMTSYY